MARFSDLIQKGLELVLVLLVLSCAADLLLQVAYRFILVRFVDFSLTWTTEYAQDALIWITYFAIGICYKEGSMASVNVVYDRLKPRGQLVLYLLTRAAVVIFLYIGFRYGWQAILSVEKWRSTNLHLPGWALYSAPFVGCIFIAYEALTELLGVLCGELKPFVGRPPKAEPEAELTQKEQDILNAMENDQIH